MALHRPEAVAEVSCLLPCVLWSDLGIKHYFWTKLKYKCIRILVSDTDAFYLKISNTNARHKVKINMAEFQCMNDAPVC